MSDSMVGRKFTLWRTEVRSKDSAYKDQFGIPHRGFVVLEEIQVEMVSERTEGETVFWTAFAPDGRAFLAQRGDGIYWQPRQEECGVWRPVDACRAYNLDLGMPYCNPEGEKIFPTGAEKCEIHDQAFIADDSVGCFDCYLEKITPAQPETATAGA